MERHIPHVLDVFTSSPGARRRARATIISKEKDEFQKNPGSDSAVSVGSSDEEDEEQRNISRYFDYLNEDDLAGGGSSQRRKKKKKQGRESRDTSVRDSSSNNNKNSCNGVAKSGGGEEGGTKTGGGNLVNNNEKNKQPSVEGGKKERSSRKGEHEKDIRHIERHLSMKKTIRKKIMRDLQQAFVEDPKDLQQDPEGLTKENKNNININNLTFSKNRLSKSEHNFLDMLKEVQPKERKGLRALMDFRKPSQSSTDPEEKVENKAEDSKPGVNETPATSDAKKPAEDVAKTLRTVEGNATVTTSQDEIRDDDSGHGSPTRESGIPRRCRSRDDLLDGGADPSKEAAKKQSFWKRITGKGKAKR